MAISFVGSHVGTHAATTARTIAFSHLRNEANAQPTLLAGDIVLVAVENSTTVNRTQAQLTPSGYTPAHTDDYRDDSNDSNFLVSYKVMGATPDTSVAIPASNATTAGVAYAIYVFRGVNPTTPLDVTPVVTGGVDTGVVNAAAITPVTPSAWIVAFAGAAVAVGANFTNPVGMSATTNHFRRATITTTTTDANIAGAIFTGWTSGAYNPASFGGSTTNTGSWSAVTIALEPILDPVSGSFAVTDTADSASLAGTVANPAATGALAVTETGADGAAMVGLVAWPVISGAFAATDAGTDSAALAGQLPVQGPLAATETGADTAQCAGTVRTPGGSFASSEAGTDTPAFAGTVRVSGAVTGTEAGSDSAALAGAVRVAGPLAASETGTDSTNFAGKVAVFGNLVGVENENDSAGLSGAVAVKGALAGLETGRDGAALYGGDIRPAITGTLVAGEAGADIAGLAGAIPVSGSCAAGEGGADGADFSAFVLIQGGLAGTEEADAATFGGAIAIAGSMSALEAAQDIFTATSAVVRLPTRSRPGATFGPVRPTTTTQARGRAITQTRRQGDGGNNGPRSSNPGSNRARNAGRGKVALPG